MAVRAFLVPALLLGALASLPAAPLDYTLAAGVSAEERDLAIRDARFKVLLAAGKYENTPYRYGGIDKNGLDCSGFVYLSFRDALAVSLPRTTTGIHAWAEKIALERAQPGDLLFFKTGNAGAISHVGIYLGGNRFIHAASEGPETGVIYSGLGEKYWARTYAGAGRALPEADLSAFQSGELVSAAGMKSPAVSAGEKGAAGSAGAGARPGSGKPADKPPGEKSAPGAGETKGHLMLGAAAAPSWNGFLAGGNIVRGVAAQLRLGAETYTFKTPMIFGLELRPEWDGALGIFRIPITLSWGLDDKFRIFAGPVFSFGSAELQTSAGRRYYTGGTSWLGAVGISAAPFAFKIARAELAPYAEFAWQSYFSDNDEANLNADFAAGLRLSTGLRFTWKF
jgi:probable lipoprotein NlpC